MQIFSAFFEDYELFIQENPLVNYTNGFIS